VDESQVFTHAVEYANPAARAAYLDAACAGNPQLRADVEALLRAHADDPGFLERPAAAVQGTVDFLAVAGVAVEEPKPAGGSEQAGMVLAGRYKLLQQIGEGGMGTVWMAEQTEPVQRKVALKIIKPGMDSRQVIARFEAERQALALMDHPNIAQVHDGGTMDSGRPYFVMELVKGIPITRYCDEQRLTPRHRLELFVATCQAVQHAHQKGIIHRDVKPSNVLVAPYDGKPVIKVIDFGVAKATGQRLTERTLFTEFGAVVGTLEYMSPEQAELNNHDIDTRSDIYALGVLLYELLTGTTPLRREQLRQKPFTEMLRMIREQEPPRPSTRLLESRDTLPAISAQRQTEPAKLTRLVRGELDWIVMKALEKDRSRRYDTATAFAGDVQRYLADEPVQACPPSAGYRFGKFVRRNRTGLAVAGLILLFIALLGGGVGWVLLDRAARQARAANELELAMDRTELFQGEGKRAEALAGFNQAQMLAKDVPPDPPRTARLAALKERLAAAGRDQEFRDRFEEIRLQVRSQVNVERSRFTREAAFREIREALRRYGIEIGVMAPAQAAAWVQGRPEPVRRDLITALDECLEGAPKGDAPTLQWLLAALAAAEDDPWRRRVRKAMSDGKWESLEQLAREAEVRKQPPGFLLIVAEYLPASMQAARLELLRRAQRAYPADLWTNHDLAYALMESGHPAEAIRYYTAALALRPESPGIYLNRGKGLLEAGELDAAIADFRQSVALAPRYFAAHDNLGLALRRIGRLDEAIAEHREAIRLKNDFFGAHYNLGLALYDKTQWDDAIAAFHRAIALAPNYAPAHYWLGLALYDKKQWDEAIAAFRVAIDIDPKDSEAHSALGRALMTKGRPDEAIAEYRQAIDLNPKCITARFNLGTALRHKGRLDEAIAEYREAIAVHPKYTQAYINLGNALADKKQWDDAIAAFRAALEIDPKHALAHFNLGIALMTKGRPDEVIAEYRQAIDLDPKYAPAHYRLGNALYDKKDLKGAIIHYRKAVELDPNHAEAHCNLGLELMRQGDFSEALTLLRRGHELGIKTPDWTYPSARWVKKGERLLELDGKLPAILKGDSQPTDAAEQAELANLCLSYKNYPAAATRLYAAALKAEPKLAGKHRYNAACAAALAGCGQGKDADQLDDPERTRWRQQALDWLRADLDLWRKRLADGTPADRHATRTMLQHWQLDTNLAGVRDAAPLKKLPDKEYDAWRQLWSDVAAVLERVGKDTAGENNPRPNP
jgi:tetratricopeptide (TPR) repeat protein